MPNPFFMTDARMQMTGQNPQIPSRIPLPRFPQAGPTQAELPGIWPIPPKPILPAGPQLPTLPEDNDPMLASRPEGYVETPYAYDLEKMIPGRAIYNGPQLNTQAALAGLKAHEQSDPTFGRIKNAYGIGSTGRAQDLGLQQGIMGDIDRQLAPQRAQADKLWGAIQQHHPAIQEAAEADAIRKAYPADVTARGQEAAATIGAQGRMAAADATRQGNMARAGATKMQGALRGLIDAMQERQGDTPEARNERVKFWLGVMQALGGGAGVEEDTDAYLDDEDF